MLRVGNGYLAKSEIISFTSPNSSPIRKMVAEAKKTGKIINMTYGKKARTVIIMTDEKIALAHELPEELLERYGSEKEENE